jgi:hypothetical protein
MNEVKKWVIHMSNNIKFKKLTNLKAEEIVDIRSRLALLNMQNSVSDLVNVTRLLSLKFSGTQFVSGNYISGHDDVTRLCKVMHVVIDKYNHYIDLVAIEGSALVSYDSIFENFGDYDLSSFRDIGILDYDLKESIMSTKDIESKLRDEISKSQEKLKLYLGEDCEYSVSSIRPMPDESENISMSVAFSTATDMPYMPLDMRSVIEKDNDVYFKALMLTADVMADTEDDLYNVAEAMREYINIRVKLRILMNLLCCSSLDVLIINDEEDEEVRLSNDLSDILSLEKSTEYDPLTVMCNVLNEFNADYGEILEPSSAFINGTNLINSLKYALEHSETTEIKESRFLSAIDLFTERSAVYSKRSNGRDINTADMIRTYVENLKN